MVIVLSGETCLMLYHGTTNARLALIKESGFVDIAPSGDRHVSLTDALDVAVYFASNSASCEDIDEKGPVVLAFNEAVVSQFEIRR